MNNKARDKYLRRIGIAKRIVKGRESGLPADIIEKIQTAAIQNPGEIDLVIESLQGARDTIFAVDPYSAKIITEAVSDAKQSAIYYESDDDK